MQNEEKEKAKAEKEEAEAKAEKAAASKNGQSKNGRSGIGQTSAGESSDIPKKSKWKTTNAWYPKVVTIDGSQGQESFMVVVDGSFQKRDRMGKSHCAQDRRHAAVTDQMASSQVS